MSYLAKEKLHATSRSHYRGTGRLSATIYGSDVEKIDDLVDWHLVGPWTPHRRSRLASQRPGEGDELQHLPSRAQSSTLVAPGGESSIAYYDRGNLCGGRWHVGAGDRASVGNALGAQDQYTGTLP